MVIFIFPGADGERKWSPSITTDSTKLNIVPNISNLITQHSVTCVCHAKKGNRMYVLLLGHDYQGYYY
jgi:hypothetical protein